MVLKYIDVIVVWEKPVLAAPTWLQRTGPRKMLL